MLSSTSSRILSAIRASRPFPGIQAFLYTASFEPEVYKSQPEIKEFLEYLVIKHCAETDLDAKGAHKAYIKGTAHQGGSDVNAKLHLTLQIHDANGVPIETIDDSRPNKPRVTKSHHITVAKDKAHLLALCAEFHKNKNASK
ncbi:hypothetical protein H0H81_006838 [Sphagnurus paluster]|uniref:Uncharacterized protein n=1 Tax=Sphagnurus paluster TaxID=117069 RepID=A0A9P7FNB8_9AGAR|nr:hypothetical protein H0H81_006838 [Sphagnurus paluster]